MYKNKYKKYKLKYLDLKGGSTNSETSYTEGDILPEYINNNSDASVADNSGNSRLHYDLSYKGHSYFAESNTDDKEDSTSLNNIEIGSNNISNSGSTNTYIIASLGILAGVCTMLNMQ
jgi:hypothetical protein